MECGEVPAPNRLQDLAAQASLLQQEIKRQKILAPPDLIEQNSFLLRQEQRRWQDAISSVERAPSQHEEKQDVLKEFQVCNRMQRVMTEVTNLIKQHAEGESRLIRAELAQLQSSESSEAPKLQELQQQVQELQTAKQKLLESQSQSRLKEISPPGEPAGKGTGAKGGKGGKGKGPPLPSSMPVPKPKAKCQAEKKKSNLVTLYWRPLPASVGSDKISASSSGLLKQCEEMLAAASGTSEASYDEEQQLGAVYDKPEAPESDNLPESMIEVYFQRREAAVHLDSGKSDKISILDEKQRRMLGILMSKYRMKNKDSDREIVTIMKQAVLSCNYEVLREEGLCMLRKVIRDHAFTGNKIREFVQANGEAALKKLRDPWLHRLIHEVLKVPQIEERLECMLFQLAFEDGFTKCAQDMETLCQALQALSAKQVELRRFFTLAHRLGTVLNSNCLAPQAPNGFSLSSLEKLIQTKSTASPKHNMLHFVLAMMTPSAAAALFTDTDVKLLAKAKAMKSFTVYQDRRGARCLLLPDCTELTQGFQAIREICQTGRYQNTTTGEKVKMERRMTKASREAEETIDANDTFHNAMQAFVGKYERQEQALFLGDLSVYPPPKEDQDGKADLVVIMHRLAAQVRRHAEEVEQELGRGLKVMRTSAQSGVSGTKAVTRSQRPASRNARPAAGRQRSDAHSQVELKARRRSEPEVPTSLEADEAAVALLQASCWLPDAIGLLVRKPLSELRAELRVEEEEHSPASSGSGSLMALSAFLRRTLQALLDLQEASHGSQAVALQEADVMMQWLVRTREELCIWGQRAGRALRALAGSELGIQELGSQLQTFIQGSMVEAMKQGSSQFDQELAQLRQELQETRSLAAAAAAEARKQEAIAVANEGSFLAKSLEQLDQKFQDHISAEGCRLREEVSRSKAQVVGELAEQQHENVQQLSKLWEAQNRQRDHELQLLRQHAESAMVEMRSSVGSAELAYSKATAEQAVVSKVLSEMQAERHAHHRQLELGQRDREALALQLTEATRQSLQLRTSLSDQEWARPEPVQTAMTPLARSRVRPLPEATESSPLRPRPWPRELKEAKEDGTGRVQEDGSSVCRVSTESVSFRRPGDFPVPETQLRRRVLEERPGPDAVQGTDKAPAVAPWELPPKEFLSIWRQSQAAATASGFRNGVTHSVDAEKEGKTGDRAPHHSTETLRITASWD
eukprot:s3819_g4.t1